MNVDPVAVSALVATASQFVLFWQRESARAKTAERREKERYDEFLRQAYEREQRASDECEERARRREDALMEKLEIQRQESASFASELKQLRAEHERRGEELRRLKTQVMTMIERTPTDQEWERSIAANPELWDQIKGVGR